MQKQKEKETAHLYSLPFLSLPGDATQAARKQGSTWRRSPEVTFMGREQNGVEAWLWK